MKPFVRPVLGGVVILAAGIAVGRLSAPGGTFAAADRSASAATKYERDGRTRSDAGIAADANIDDLLTMVSTGRSRTAMAKVTMSLQELSPARLAQLADEVRDLQRRKPGYDWNQYQLQDAILSAWTSADPQAALAFIRDSPSRSFRANAMGTVFAVLGEADPENAIALAQELGEPGERRNALSTLAWTVGQRDPEHAMELFGKMKEIPESSRVAILNELAKKDPVKAADLMSRISPLERDRYWNSEGIFSTWAANDPDAVLAWAQSATDLDMRNSAMKAACMRWATDDPAAAMKKIDTLPSHLRKELLTSVISTWADRDLKGALAAAGALAQPAEREAAMSAIVDQMDYVSPELGTDVVLAMSKGNARDNALQRLSWGIGWQTGPEKMRILEKFQGVERSRLAGMLAPTMLAEDAEGAIKLFSSIPPIERDSYSLQRFVSSLAGHDPEKALAFAEDLDSATERSQAVKSAMEQLVRLSPSDAANRLASIDNPNDRQQALTALATSWGHTDSAAALAWANSLSGSEKTSALASILPMQAANDPQGAGTQLRGLLENPGDAPSSVLQNATSRLANEWAGRNPEDTARWIQGLPQGSAAEAGANALVRNWSNHDPAAAAGWLSNLPDGGVKDAAIEPLVSSIRQTDPQSAFDWGLTITDASKRAAVMEQTIRNWGGSDPESVKAALQSARLDPAEREKYDKLLK